MSDNGKRAAHFNKATVFGRVDGVPTRKLSNEGKGRPYWRLKVICANAQHGNVFAYGRIWNKDKAEALIDYLKKTPAAGIKLVGFFNQYDHDEPEKGASRRSNFTWYDWQPDKCENPRAAFLLTGKVDAIQGDLLFLRLEREGNDPEDFEVHALERAQLKSITEGDVVKIKGYIRSLEPEDEFGDTANARILPYIEQVNVVEGDFA